jgi:hypothetical protein
LKLASVDGVCSIAFNVLNFDGFFGHQSLIRTTAPTLNRFCGNRLLACEIHLPRSDVVLAEIGSSSYTREQAAS